jgi:hypothetical protein
MSILDDEAVFGIPLWTLERRRLSFRDYICMDCGRVIKAVAPPLRCSCGCKRFGELME